MAAIDYRAVMDAIKTRGESVMSSYGWFRDRYDASGGNMPKAVNVCIAFGGIRTHDITTGGPSRILTVLLGVVVRGKDFQAVEELLTDAIAAIEYQFQPPTLTAPYFALSPALIVRVSMEATREGADRALVRLNLTLYNES
jgi:hypothetical protein